MKNILLILVALGVMISPIGAQTLRIGERLPHIDVDSSAGPELKLINKEFACMIFMHSGNQLSLDAIRAFTEYASPLSNRLAVVLVTPEQDCFGQEMLNSIATSETIVAFDNDRHTFDSFRVEHIPFGVIYTTRTRRVEWFGSLSQMNSKQLNNIVK